MRSWTDIKRGQVHTVRVELPEGQVKTRAEVMRIHGPEVGLRFLELDQDSLAAVLAYVAIRLGPPKAEGETDTDDQTS